MVENTHQAAIMRNLGFILANKLLSPVFASLLEARNERGALRNASTSYSRLRWEKKVDAYKSITFTLAKETDLFFASCKNQEWAQTG